MQGSLEMIFVNVSFTELPDDTLVLLRACCDLQVVPALCCLVSNRDGAVTRGDSRREWPCPWPYFSPIKRRYQAPVGIAAVGSAWPRSESDMANEARSLLQVHT